MYDKFAKIDISLALVHLRSVVVLHAMQKHPGAKALQPRAMPEDTLYNGKPLERLAHVLYVLERASEAVGNEELELANRWLGYAEGLLEAHGISHSQMWGVHCDLTRKQLLAACDPAGGEG